MKKIDLGQTIAIFANIGVIAGIVFLGYELRQNRLSTDLEVIQGYSDNLSELDEFIANNRQFSELLARMAEEGLEIEDLERADEIQMRAWHRWQLREWESSYNLYELTDPTVDNLRRHIRGQVGVAPRVYEIWRGRKDTFSDEFNELMQDIGDELGLE